MEPTKDETAGSGLRLPSSPIASEQANDGTTQGRLPAVSSKRKPETTHLPSVLTDLASLEHERQRLVLELQGLKESQAAVDARLVAAEESRNARLEALGKHDRFFLKDRGQHPLGRRYAVQQTAINIQKQMERLNNERTKLLGKMNNAIDGNNAVKTRIDVLRRESVVFRGLFTKMEAELAGLKKTIASDKQAIEQAYEARDAAQLEMQEIEQELKLTKAEIEAEFTTLSVNMSSSVDFMAVPNMGDTSGSGLSTTRRSKKSGKGGSDRQASSIKKLTKAQKYAKLQEEWKAITDATGISDPDELVDFFKTAESQKFSKVTAITELVTEVSVLERELKDFADVTLADLTERREASEKQAATTKLLDDGIVTTESAIAAISDETKDILRQFEELLPVVHQTFQKIGCEKMFSEDSINQMNAAAAVVAEGGEAVVATDVTRPVLPPMFAAPSFVQAIRSGITVHNLPMFLGVIEFRASEIMQQYSALFPNGRPDPGPGNYSSRPGTTSLNLASSLGGGSPSLSAMLGTPTGLNTSRKSPFKFGAGEGASSPSTDPVAKFKAGSLGPSAPSGSVKLVVQSSAIRAAMMETERDETDDYDRPLSRMELQARAAVHANRSSNQATKSAALAAAVVLSSATDAGATSHFVKHVPFLGRTVPILLQNENGPCPLLAICNVLLLRGHISVHADVGMISADELVQLVAERLIAANPVTDDSPRMADLQRILSDVMGVLPQLRVGLDVNVRFQSCEDFEYTPECATFDLLGIRLLHGWLVDPEAVDVHCADLQAGAVGRQSYNQLVEVLVSSPSEAPVAPSATAEAAETTASPVNPEQPDEEVPATPTAVSRTAVIRRFLDESASQLTAAGLKALRETLKENELAVFFRNNHFSVVFKHGGDALLLVTDVGFKSQPNIVWERLDSISGDTVYLNGLFTQPTASEVVPVPRTSQEEIVADSLSQNLVNPDLLLALSLQEQEAPHSAPEGPSAHGFATPAVIPPSPTDAAFDADLAAALAASVGNSAASPPPPAHLARGPTTVDDEAEYARQLELALAASRAEFTGGAAGGVPPSVVTVAPPVRAVGTVAQPSVAPAAAAPKPKPRMGTAVYQDQAAALREANEARAARQRATMTDEEFARREQAREDSLRGPSSASRQQGDKKKKDCCIM